MKEISEAVEKIGKEIIELRRKIYTYPELGGEEIKTTETIKNALKELEKIEILEGGLKTGVVAVVKGKEDGPTIALRADIDALPISEKSGYEFSSKIEGKMHACGHDVHTAGLIGCAKVLNDLAKEGKLEGNVVLIFQPSEERTHELRSGSIRVIRALERLGLREKLKAFLAYT